MTTLRAKAWILTVFSYDTPGLTIARLAHIDLEGLVLDSKVRTLRDRNVTTEWSQCLYNGKRRNALCTFS